MRKKKKPAGPFFKYAIVVTALFVLFLFLKKDGLVSWVKAGFIVRSQEKTIEDYRKKIKLLDEEASRRSSDLDSLEKFARENYGFSESGDDVYIIR